MKKKIVAYLLAITAVLCFIVIDAEAKKPEIIRYDAQYLDRQVSLNLQWQSSEAIVSVRVAAGKEVKEIKIDAFENKKTRSGYSGEVNVALQTDPIMFQDSISYTLQVEDEDGQKSNLVHPFFQISCNSKSLARIRFCKVWPWLFRSFLPFWQSRTSTLYDLPFRGKKEKQVPMPPHIL